MSVCERRLLKLNLCTFESTTEYLASPHRGAPIRGATIATLLAWRSTCQSATQAMHLEQLKLENESISHSGIFFFIDLILKGVCRQKPIAQRTKESHTNSLGLGCGLCTWLSRTAWMTWIIKLRMATATLNKHQRPTKVILHAQKRIESSNDLFGAHSQLDLPGDHSRKHGHRFRCLVREIDVVPPKHAPWISLKSPFLDVGSAKVFHMCST